MNKEKLSKDDSSIVVSSLANQLQTTFSKLSNSFDVHLSLGPSFSFTFNAGENRFEFFSPEILTVLGYDSENLSNTSLFALFRHIHPEDIQPFITLLRNIKEFIQSPSNNESDCLKMLIDFRLKHAKGKYVRLLVQIETHEMASEHHNLKWIGLASDISFLKLDGELSFRCQNEQLQNRVESRGFKTKTKKVLFSSREREILKLLAKGFNSRMIQDALNISQHTIRTHRRNMHKRCNVENTAQLIKLATREGYI